MVTSEKHDGHPGANGSNGGNGTPEPARPERLELQEQYTLDNPPVSYEQRVQREKKCKFNAHAARSSADQLGSNQPKSQPSRERGISRPWQLPFSYDRFAIKFSKFGNGSN
jgi:hypothetical protein